MKPWLLLIYRVPRKPTSKRVFVWRKLKQLGALALQDAVWVLPASPRTREQFQWLAVEITELEGEATLFESEQVFATDNNALQRQFVESVEGEYRDILAALRQRSSDVAMLAKQFQQVHGRDFFASPLGPQVRDRLLSKERKSRQ